MTSLDHQERLKHYLHTADASKIQELTAELIGRLLHLPIAVANAGFQHGADAGPAGQHGRRFRIECKRYRDSTGLRERELLGEIDQALGRDQAIEAWVLVATCTVSEQIRQSLDQKGETTGVPVVIIDWVDTRIAPLAALCAFAPDLVETKVSEHAAHAARALHEVSVEEVEVLRRNLESWCIGYESVRERSHQQLARIWNSRKEAKAAFGQDVAGGAQRARIRRNRVHHALDEWWYRSPNADSPAAVVGLDGVAKTWATLDWLLDTIDRQPIVLTIPASAGVERSLLSAVMSPLRSLKQLHAGTPRGCNQMQFNDRDGSCQGRLRQPSSAAVRAMRGVTAVELLGHVIIRQLIGGSDSKIAQAINAGLRVLKRTSPDAWSVLGGRSHQPARRVAGHRAGCGNAFWRAC